MPACDISETKKGNKRVGCGKRPRGEQSSVYKMSRVRGCWEEHELCFDSLVLIVLFKALGGFTSLSLHLPRMRKHVPTSQGCTPDNIFVSK